MKTHEQLLALADDYASSHNAHTIHRLKETRTALSDALRQVCEDAEKLEKENTILMLERDSARMMLHAQDARK
jgi:GAF domain-containing protein